MKTRVWTWCLVVCAWSWPGAALADRRQEAERLAKAGELLFDARKYQDALKQFLDARERFEPPGFVIPEVLWNIGRCYEELGDDLKAVGFFEEFLGVVTDPEYRAAGEAKVREVRGRLRAEWTFEVEPHGTTVRVDGREVGVAPLPGPVRLEPGRHVVSFARPGYRPREEAIEVRPGEAGRHRVALERQEGVIRVVGTGGPPAGDVVVFVDGQPVYQGPVPAQVPAAAGRRTLRVDGPPGTEPIIRYLEVPDQGEVEVATAFPVPKPVVEARPTPSGPGPGETVRARPAEVRKGFPWHFVVIGGGAALVAGGGVMTALAAKDRGKVTGAGTASDGVVTGIARSAAASAASAAKTKDTVSYVLYGAGGAAVVGGILWWLLGEGGGDTAGPSASLTLVPVAGGSVLGAGGVF